MKELAASLVFSLLSLGSSQATTINIPADYLTIQEGIHSATDGDTVLVAPGTYTGLIDFSGKRIVLTSSHGAEQTVLAPPSGATPIRMVSGEPEGTELRGFTITGVSGGTGHVIMIENDSRPTIAENIFYDNQLSGNELINVWPEATIEYNLFLNNGGIACVGIWGSLEGITVNNNTFSNNARGIFSINGGGNVTDNIIVNSMDYGLWGEFAVLDHNDVWSNVPNYDNGASPGPASISVNPRFCDPLITNFEIADSSPCAPANSPNGVLIGAYGVGCTYICVDSDEDGFGDPDHPENTCPDDNCPLVFNPGQSDADMDTIGDSCDTCTDTDDDGYGNPEFPENTCPDDNCPDVTNPGQEDSDTDGVGDLCDNCQDGYNPDQGDADVDGTGDTCDTCTDVDGDGYGNPGYPANTCADDNCPGIYNPDQLDSDGDGIGDACECMCGDANGDGLWNISDPVFLIQYTFGGGPAPDPLCNGDADGNSLVGISDAVYLIAYIFGGGPEPHCPGQSR